MKDGVPTTSMDQVILHHVGLACQEINSARRWFVEAFPTANVSQIVIDPLQNAELCLVSFDTGSMIELVSGPIVKTVLEKGTPLYHICFEAPNFAAHITHLQSLGCILVAPPTPARLFSERLVAFLYGPHGLIEILSST